MSSGGARIVSGGVVFMLHTSNEGAHVRVCEVADRIHAVVPELNRFVFPPLGRLRVP